MVDVQCSRCKSYKTKLIQVKYKYSSPLFTLRKHGQAENPARDLTSIWVIRILLLGLTILGFSGIYRGGVPVRGSHQLIPFADAPVWYSLLIVAIVIWLTIGFFITFDDEAKIRNAKQEKWYQCLNCSYSWTVIESETESSNSFKDNIGNGGASQKKEEKEQGSDVEKLMQPKPSLTKKTVKSFVVSLGMIVIVTLFWWRKRSK